ncbi:hypothetical protein Agub_g14034 [Astrephomene gubernaculifera]|uniref:Uncharacterized protein n=1 Tax=Astrephomene gubernaculifera TaxID=47775 RepID=A0AAD3E2W4_9CHLO|nr:hypothetical protein Agub_g14034 [Astrephomene gubernaculifera]
MTPRYVVAYFNHTPAARSGQVASVVLYVTNKGTLNPAIASIDLLLRLATAGGANSNSREQQWVTLYSGSTGQQLTCPGLNYFAVSAAAAMTSAIEFNTADVIAVRINVNGATVSMKSELPHLAAVGLQLS